MKGKLVLGIALAGLLSTTYAANWSYSGKRGAGHWGALTSKYRACATGKHQSPIPLPRVASKGGVPIEFELKSFASVAKDNGNTIQVEVTGNGFSVGSDHYEIQQFHFHHPSEHFIGRRQYPMELHFVGESRDGNFAVVGVFIKRGKANALIEKLWTQKPVDGIDLIKLLPKGHRYFSYKGSLTTPPCSEGFRWLVMKDPITLSDDQIHQFSMWYSDNARPLQPLNDRVVKLVHPK